ncbi:MAG: gamma-glutamylcyclotransferase [Christensenellaceae bacterium]|jgi:hypothetical protein|nr:gamma-glutamylcyclotransferase [Christensenellaceae bacterium]
MNKTKYYIAYGSNLNKKQMSERCPSAVFVGAASITGYELIFKRVASIEEKKGAILPVGIWEIDDICERSLDRYEGYPRTYGKKNIKFKLGEQELSGICYIKNAGLYELPTEVYYNKIETGYNDFELDINYLIKAFERTKERIK